MFEVYRDNQVSLRLTLFHFNFCVLHIRTLASPEFCNEFGVFNALALRPAESPLNEIEPSNSIIEIGRASCRERV